MRVTCSVRAAEATGPSCSGVTTCWLSACQASMRWADVLSRIGALAVVNGSLRLPVFSVTPIAAFGTSP